MAKKNKKATTSTANPSALKIGSRVRCTEDGVEGRVVWANGLMVKVEWTDGERVTWRRDTLATKPIEILDDETPPASEPNTEQPTGEPQAEPAAVPTTTEETNAHEETSAAEESPTPEVRASEPTADAPAPEPLPETTSTTTEAAPTEAPASETLLPVAEPINWNVLDASKESPTYLQVLGTVTATTLGDAQAAAKTLYTTPHIVRAPETPTPESSAPEAAAAQQSSAPAVTAPKRTRKAKKPEGASGGDKKLSALDAAAKVLADAGKPLSCQEMIDRMAATSLWRSPGGRTPSATLYSAILRELATKGNNSRFAKVGRGQFAYHAQE